MSEINKLGYGVIATDSDRDVTAEQLSARTQAIPSDVGPILVDAGSVRVLGDLSRAALFNDSTPSSHPTRNRRLTQQKLIVGAEVWAEGTQGIVTGTFTFDTGGITVTGFPTTLRLVVTGGPVNVAVLGSFQVVSLVGTTITTLAPMNLGAGYTWQLVSLAPAQLLPMPSKTGFAGSETTYLTVLPPKWPVGDGARKIFEGNIAYNGTMTIQPSGRIQFSGTHVQLTPFFQTDDIVYLGSVGTSTRAGVRARVDSVNFTPGVPSTEILSLEPLFGEEVLDYTAATRVTKLAQVRDFTSDPYGLVVDRSLYNTKEFLESVRVYPLISPVNGPSVLLPNSPAPLLGSGSISFVADKQSGYSLVLYPADISGNPDLTRPVTNFEDIVINPTLDEPQSVRVDYAQGAIVLSHPIPENGDLNPNGYIAPDGTRRLFAVFVAYNRSYAPESVRSLKADGPLTGTSIAFEPKDSVYPLAEPLNRVAAWAVRPDELQEYHVTSGSSSLTSPAVAVTSDTEGLVSSRSPQILFQRRSQNIPITNIGGLFFGPSQVNGIGANSSSVSQIALYPTAVGESVNPLTGTPLLLDTSVGAHIGFSEGWKDLQFSVPFVVVLGATGVQLYVNDLEVQFSLPIGLFSDGAFQSLLGNAILAAGLAAGAEQIVGRDFYITNPSPSVVILNVRDQLVVGSGTAHATLGLTSNTRIRGVGIFENIFSGNQSGVSENASWDYNLRSFEQRYATWRGSDINIDLGPSLQGVGSSYDSSYADMIVESDGPTTYAGDVVNVQDFRAHTRIQEYGLDVIRYVPIRGDSVSLTGLGSGLYLIYWDRFTRAFVTILDALVTDKTLQTGLYQGIPIAKVVFDGADVTDLQTSMVFAQNRRDTDILTVGVGGMFETIQAACYWIETHNPTTRHIHLVSDIVSDALYGGDSYIPSGVTLDGNGYTITISNYVAPINKSLFYLRGLDTNVASRGVILRNFKIVYDNLANQVVAGMVADNAASPPVSDSDFGITLENIYYDGDDGGSNTNVLAAVVFGQYTLDLNVDNCYFADLDLSFNGFFGCRRYNVHDCEFINTRGNLLGSASLFGLSISERLSVSNVIYAASTSITELCAFIRNGLGQFTSGCTINLENVRASMNFSDFMSLDNTTVSVRSDITMKDCRITSENETQQFIAGVTRRVNVKVENCEFLRLSPSGTAPAAGFVVGDDTGGGQASFWSFSKCLIDGSRFTAPSYDDLKIQVESCVVTGQSNILANAGSGVGSFELLNNDWTGGVFNFTEWKVTMTGGSYQNTLSILAPFVQFIECDVHVSGGIRFSKTSTDTNPLMRFRLACSADFSDVFMEHGNGLTGSSVAIQINGDASFTRFSVANIGLTYLGTAVGSGASGFVFLLPGSPVQASFTLTGFIYRGYPNIASASSAMFFTANWSLFTIGSGFTISATPGLNTFVGSGAPTEIYIEPSARFTP